MITTTIVVIVLSLVYTCNSYKSTYIHYIYINSSVYGKIKYEQRFHKERLIMKKAWLVSFIRLPLLLLIMSLMSLLLNIPFPFSPDIAVIYFMIANLLSLYLMTRLLHSEGRSIWDVIDFQRDRLGKDLLWGLLWIFVLFIPFAAAVNGVAFLIFGTDYLNQFEVIFTGDLANNPLTTPVWLRWVGAIVALFFPFINAPIEEIMYRGYAQP